MKRRVVTYIRVSTETQASRGFSIPAQQQVLRDYALGHDLEIVEEFIESESAFKPGRPGFKKMIDFLNKRRDVTAVLCYRIDRLSRNLQDYAVLDEMGWVSIISATEGLPENATGKLVGVIQAGISRHYSQQLSERVVLGLETKARKGKWPGHAPVGYVNLGRGEGIAPDPDRADLVRELFRVYLETGMTLDELTDWAKGRWLRTRRGVPLCRSAIHRLLSNPVYIGLIRWNGITHQGTHEPLVTAAVFERAQDRLSGRVPARQERRFPYRGLLTCARCGCKITASMAKGKYPYYHCTGARGGCRPAYVREDRLGEMLVSVVRNVELSSSQAGALVRAIHDREDLRQDEQHRRKTHLQTRLDTLARRRSAAYEDKLDGKLDETQWLEFDKGWSWEAIQVRQLLDEATDDRGPSEEDVATTLELLRCAPELYIRQSASERVRLLKVLVWNCRITGENIEPVYNKPFDLIAEGRRLNSWLGERDSNPH